MNSSWHALNSILQAKTLYHTENHTKVKWSAILRLFSSSASVFITNETLSGIKVHVVWTILDVNTLCNVGILLLLNSHSSSSIVTVAWLGVMVTCSSVSPGGGARLRKKISEFSGIVSLKISTRKHSCRCESENGPTTWFVIAV